jgi:DNA helicase-4
MFLQFTALDLIDQLLGCWSDWESNKNYYLKVLAPAIVGGEGAGHLMANEKEIIALLQGLLSAQEWERLPELIAKRHAHQLEEIESDRRRRERERERERLEAEKRRKEEELRRERERREEEHRRREAEERRRREEEIRRRKQAFIARAHSTFESAFLEADTILIGDSDRMMFSDMEFFELKCQFVQEWASRELDQPLDIQQAAAVAATGGDVQVVARAGAGKTRTLVTRALFLHKHCDVAASDLLLLAFNRAAALEMRRRFEEAVGDAVPHVMTFHALAHALVHPEEALIYDEPSAGNIGLSREIQRVIDEHLRSEKYRPLIRDLMLLHFREDWERIVEGGFHLRIDELIKYRSALPRETLKGEYVKSFGERLIANTLFQNDIEYKYERNYRWNGINYKPDFTILLPDRRGIAIEYFGLRGDPDYDRMSQQKRKFWANREGWTLLEFSPIDITSRGVEGFAALQLERLEELGVKGQRLSEEELWKRIRRRAIDKFTGAIKSFVSRCRKLNLSIDQLRRDTDRHTPITEAERLFLEVGASVYSDYLRRLTSSQQEDFDGMMWRAVALLADGESRFARDKGRERGDLRSIRFVLVDEFQDFSEMFYSLSRGIWSLNPSAQFFCVGDDWQAINGFAGSDLRFFEDFTSFFRATRTLSVTTNYRSPVQVVELGNALMRGRGAPAVPFRSDRGCVRTCRLSEFTPSAAEEERHNGDEATPTLLRLVRHILDSGRDVVMLSRRNDVPWYVSYAPELPGGLNGLERFAEHVRSFLPEDDRPRLTASTAHKYKGLERDAVIVLDANEGSYPLIHPNWVFLRLFGDTIERIESEERRLFYVALTRSRHTLVILSDSRQRQSPYLTDIESYMKLDSIALSELPMVPSLDGARVEVQVSNAFHVRDQLKELGYRWSESAKCWCRSLLEEGFSFEALSSQSWAQPGVRIEVYSEAGKLLADNGEPQQE